LVPGRSRLGEGLDVLLHRHAADVEEDRPRQALVDVGLAPLRVEDVGVDAARPGRDVAEAVPLASSSRMVSVATIIRPDGLWNHFM
jgi:hypothetical protein